MLSKPINVVDELLLRGPPGRDGEVAKLDLLAAFARPSGDS